MDKHLHTDRLSLRPPRASDAPHAHARWACDPAVLRYLEWPPHTELSQTEHQLAWDEARWLKRSAYTWMLTPRTERHPVGQIQLVPQRLNGPAHHLRLGYLLAPAWQGQGLMREALSEVIRHALAQAEVWRVDAVCDTDNQPSRRLLDSLGLNCEGQLRHWAHHPNVGPEPRDVWLYAATRPLDPTHT
jgi:ribosomal-protein-alanine N-acetyltransferase